MAHISDGSESHFQLITVMTHKSVAKHQKQLTSATVQTMARILDGWLLCVTAGIGVGRVALIYWALRSETKECRLSVVASYIYNGHIRSKILHRLDGWSRQQNGGIDLRC